MIIPPVHAQPGSKSVAQLVQQANLRDIRMGLQEGGWLQGVEAELAHAVLNESGLGAFQAFHTLSKRNDLSREAQSLIWFNLYGYYRITNNTAKLNQCIDKLNSLQPEAGKFFYQKSIPVVKAEVKQVTKAKPKTGNLYSLQLGAFGNKTNAERLASKNRKKGFTVKLHPIKRRNKTLYLVLVGEFSTESQAKAFGTKNFGRSGKDFHVYKLNK